LFSRLVSLDAATRSQFRGVRVVWLCNDRNVGDRRLYFMYENWYFQNTCSDKSQETSHLKFGVSIKQQCLLFSVEG